VHEVHAYYGDSHVLQGTSLRVEAGTVVALLGRNGVGKTTLMHAIMGMMRVSSGEIVLAGRPIQRLPPERIATCGVALVPRGRRVFRSLSSRENLAVAERKQPGGGGWGVERVRAELSMLSARWFQRAGTLSGGEQQMLATARALVRNPRLLLLDEPTEGLAPFIVDQLRSLIESSRREGAGVLLVEQKLSLAFELADYLYIMDRGRMVYESVPWKLRQDGDALARFLAV
jgi:branched-chain amino acid transport system ATP-binding protein